MKRALCACAGCLVLAAYCGAAFPDPHDEGVAAGQAATSVVNGMVNPTSATRVLPPGYYNPNPPETSLYGLPNLSGNTAARIAWCGAAAAANDTTCQATRTGIASAGMPHPSVSPTEASVLGARAATTDPEAQGVTLSGVYSACTTQTQPVSPAVYDTQSCNNYYLRSVDNACRKTLTVEVTWDYVCPAGTISGPTQVAGSTAEPPDKSCEVQTAETQYQCTAPDTGPSIDALGNPVCTTSTGATVAATAVTVTQVRTELATPVATETDHWANGCAALESLVPPGYLMPDGDNTSVGPGGTTSSIAKCFRTNSVCSDAAPSTRRINYKDVTRACWQWTNTFDCITDDGRSDCAQPRFGLCQPKGPPVCVEMDTITVPPFCNHERQDFSCKLSDAVVRTVEICGTQRFCDGGNCWDTSYPPDADFAKSVAYLEAGREAGKYFDASSFQVFKGHHDTCTKKLFGIVNCCNKGGTDAVSSFSNLSLALSAVSTVGKAAFSSYTYDALFTSDAPDLAITGFEALFGTGLDSGLAGLLAGDLAVGDFVLSLVPSYWTIAMLAIEYSGLLSCSDEDKITAMKRDARLCVEFGDYCSSCISVFGHCVACLERTKSFCCFNSHLARIINEQGRAQVGKGWGGDTARSPDCSGFTVGELQSLDFSRMDLSEFYAEIKPTILDTGAAAGKAAARVPSCYWGNGQCGP
jgi:conjugal transfer mating pair stabilization protein TraN